MFAKGLHIEIMSLIVTEGKYITLSKNYISNPPWPFLFIVFSPSASHVHQNGER